MLSAASAFLHWFLLWHSPAWVWTVSSLSPVSRRSCLGECFATTCRGMFLVLPLSVVPTTCPRPAWAIKERNEALCQTGFFTNIMQYRCTEIGDISDEGKAQDLSESQESSTDTLLSKLKLESDNNVQDEDLKVSGSNESRWVNGRRLTD